MGILDPIYEAIGWLLSIYYAVIPNFGIAIILLTFTIMGLLFPLTAKQARSMIRMQMVQPEIKRIQAKYKNDRAKLNEEMMKFYQENKINPLAGCLPLLVQMPIFFSLFQVLRNPYKYVPTGSKLYEAFCTVPGTNDLVGVNACGKGDLPVPQEFLGLNLSLKASSQATTWAEILGFGLVVLVMFTGYMQSRQAQKRTPAINKQMALITKVLPVFFGFISLNFPSGLVLYFFVSNLWRLGQQEVIFRRYGTAAAPRHKSLIGSVKAPAVDAVSREVDTEAKGTGKSAGKRGGAEKDGADAADGNGKAATPAKAKSATPARSGKTTPTEGKPVVPPSPSGGGLRALFRPPPPATGKPVKPDAKPTPKSPKKSTTTSAPTSAPTSRPGTAGRRSSKKRKKR